MRDTLFHPFEIKPLYLGVISVKKRRDPEFAKLLGNRLEVTADMLFQEVVSRLKNHGVQHWNRFTLRGDHKAEIIRIAPEDDLFPHPKKGTLWICPSGKGQLSSYDAWVDASSLDSAVSKSLLAMFWDCLFDIWRWSESLEELLRRGESVSGMLEYGERNMGCAMAVFDKGLGIVAASPGYGKNCYKSGSGELILTEDRARELIEDVNYINAARHTGFLVYPEDAGPDDDFYITYNHIPPGGDGDWDARIVVSVGKRAGWVDRVRYLHTFPYFAERIFEYIFSKQVISDPNHSQSDAMHYLLRAMASKYQFADPSFANTAFPMYGWDVNDKLVAMRVDFFEGSMWSTATGYLCSLIEEKLQSSCAIVCEGHIIIVVDIDRGDWGSSLGSLVGSLTDLMVDYAFKLGIGNSFRGIENLSGCCRQAELALEYGSIRDPHLWYYTFSDYAIYYLIRNMSGEFDAISVCHSGIIALMEHDAEHGTEYIETLRAYEEERQNSTHAAKRLFIHRSSLLRRLERIERISGIDLSDPDQSLYAFLSLRMLES